MMIPAWLKENVSRETSERLSDYVGLIEKWNPRINLVSKNSLLDVWDRHIWDSAQIFDIHAPTGIWADIGSGGGLPAIVLAIMAQDRSPKALFHLLESDQRKCAFLRTCVRELGLNAQVTARRIEDVAPIKANVVSARALSDLNMLLSFAERHCSDQRVAIFPKGATWEKELEIAQQNWSFEFEAHKSQTNPDAVILKIKDFARV